MKHQNLHLRASLLMLAALLLFAGSGAGSVSAAATLPLTIPPLSTSKSGVAAEVNSELISMAEMTTFGKVVAIRLQQQGIDARTASGRTLFYQQVASTFQDQINTALVVAYAKKHNLVAPKAQVDAQVAAIMAQQGGKASFVKDIQQQGYTYDLIYSLLGAQVTESLVGNAVTAKAPCPCDVHVRHILLSEKDKALATKLAKELQADKGSNFAALAKKYSIDASSKNRAGDLGFVQRGMMIAAFEQAVFSLKVGQVSNPVHTQFGWHIIQVLGTQPSQAQRQAFFKTWLANQHAHASIHTYLQLPKP